jgi:carboxylesterase
LSAVDPGPYDLGPRHAERAVLCLHGLTGTPYEVRPIAEALAASGIRARGPALPGHCSKPGALAATPYTAWLEAARGEIEKLRVDHEFVGVAGMSMGAVVALQLASEGAVDAIVSIGAPLALRPWPLPLLMPLLKVIRANLPKRNGSDIRDDDARARHPGYDTMPLAAVHELIKLQRQVVPRLSRITVPIFVGHGAHDATAHPEDATRIVSEVSSAVRTLRIFEESAHVVPVDRDGPQLAAEAVRFFALR